MASIKQQKPGNESSPQEQNKFWGSKVFGGKKQSIENQQNQSNGWWFNSHKQGQHCSTCKCEAINKKDQTIGISIIEDQTTKNGKGTLQLSDMKTKEQSENHCFKSMADHVKQRIAMMKNSHGDESSDSDSDDDKAEKKKEEKRQTQGTKITAKNEKNK